MGKYQAQPGRKPADKSLLIEDKNSTSDAVVDDGGLVKKTVGSSAAHKLSRRTLIGSIGVAAATVGSSASAQTMRLALAKNPEWRGNPVQPRVRQGFSKDLSRLIDLNGTNQGGQYWNYNTYITPIDDFFIRNEYPTPTAATDRRVDPRHWRLRIHGDAVEHALEITYDDLLSMPSKSITSTMECAGNGRSLFWEQQGMVTAPEQVTGTGWTFGGIGQAEWQYVPMSYILGLVGIKKTARAALFWSGVDGQKPGLESDCGRPIPASMLRARADDIGLAFKMNGRDLLPDHGAPVRALVPGWAGAASIKWLTEIKIATHNFWVPLNTKRHVLIGPQYKPAIAKPGDEFRFATAADIRGETVTWSPPRSTLTLPMVLKKQPKHPGNYPLKPGEVPTIAAGRQTMNGFAWAPQHGVKKVEVRVNGTAWQKVRLADSIGLPHRWTRFSFPLITSPGRYEIETRVTDMQGTVQPPSVPFNEGGFNFWAVPKFHLDAV